MPKTKTVKKSVSRVSKKSPVKKITKPSTSKVLKVESKKRPSWFRVGIVLILTFLALSVYQAFASGTGLLSFLASKSEVFVVTDGGTGGGVATCNLPESVCKTVNGCTWKPGVPAIPAVFDTTTIKCTDSNCPDGCKVSTKNVASTAPGQCEQAGLSQAKCSQLGYTWTPGKTIYTKVDTCTGTVENDRLVKAAIAAIPGSCSGTPIAPPVVSQGTPPPNAYIPATSKPPIPDYCKTQCAPSVDSDACKSCLAN